MKKGFIFFLISVVLSISTISFAEKELVKLLRSLKSEGKTIAGYGAPARGNTLLNYCKIGRETLDYVVDASPLRQNKFIPGMHIPIVAPEKMRESPPDYALLLAWSYFNEVMKKEQEFLKKGGKFEDIAKKSSKDAGSGANGGDLDWANPSSYVPEFAEAMTKMNKGQLTDVPVKTQFGYHIIRVDDIRTAQLPPFEELKPQIAQQMQQQKLAAFQQGLREKAKVE